MPLSRRYSPELAPNEGSLFGMDFSSVIPPGVGIDFGECAVVQNTQPVQDASTMITVGTVQVVGRTLIAFIESNQNAEGRDFQVRWIAFDSEGGVWPRTALVLCAQTS